MKKIIYTLIILAVVFVIPSEVSASEAVCVYGNKNIALTFKANSDSSAVTLTTSGEVSGYYFLANGLSGAVTAINMQDTKNNLWKCPDTLYYSMTSAGRSITIGQIAFSNAIIDDPLTFSKIVESSSDGNKISENSVEVTDSRACKYGSLTITYTPTKMTYTDSSGAYQTNLLFEVGNLSSSACPEKVYLYSTSARGYTINNYYLNDTEQSGGEWISLGFKVTDATGENTTTEDVVTPEYTEVNGCAILGEHITPMIKWAIRLIYLLIPILIIILTIVEFTKIVLSADEKEYKTAINHLIKRIGIGVAIIVLPTIISILIDLSGILNQYGITDDLFCSLFK